MLFFKKTSLFFRVCIVDLRRGVRTVLVYRNSWLILDYLHYAFYHKTLHLSALQNY